MQPFMSEYPKITLEAIVQWETRSTWMLRCPRSIPGRGKKYISEQCFLKWEFEHGLVFVPVPNAKKLVLFGFNTGTKSEKLNFYSS